MNKRNYNEKILLPSWLIFIKFLTMYQSLCSTLHIACSFPTKAQCDSSYSKNISILLMKKMKLTKVDNGPRSYN